MSEASREQDEYKPIAERINRLRTSSRSSDFREEPLPNQPNINGYRDPTWWERKLKPWEMYPGPDNPRISIVKVGDSNRMDGQKYTEIEYRWWVDPCPELVDPLDECPGYIVEHYGPRGEWSRQLECPDHGFRWKRSDGLSDIERKQALSARLHAAQIPPQFAAWTFYTFPKQDSNALMLCKEYARAGKLTSSLFMSGGYGVGKTSLAVSILKERIEKHGERGMFCVVPSLFAEIKSLFGREGESSALLQKVMNVPLLVLDDLGAEKASEWVQEQLYNILNTRLINGRPTIVTTNLTQAELTDKLGRRIVERMKSYQNALEMGGDNMRDWRTTEWT